MGSAAPTVLNMGVPEAVLQKVGAKPDVDAMSKDDLAALCKQLYERSCTVFGEKFDEEFQVKKRDMEIHTLEMETSESHGTFKIPKLKKVKKLQNSPRMCPTFLHTALHCTALRIAKPPFQS